MSLLLALCEEIPPESLPVSDTVSSLKSDAPASEWPFITEETVDHTSSCEFLLKISHLPFFGSRFHRQDFPQPSPPFTSLTTSDGGKPLYGRLENTLPFGSQSINNFSGIDISQSVDWESPSLPPPPPHFLLPCLTAAVFSYSVYDKEAHAVEIQSHFVLSNF